MLVETGQKAIGMSLFQEAASISRLPKNSQSLLFWTEERNFQANYYKGLSTRMKQDKCHAIWMGY